MMETADMRAGSVNLPVSSGALVTSPTMLFLSYSPIVANVSDNIGGVAGGLCGSHGYRRELRGYLPLLRPSTPASLAGRLTGHYS